MKTRMDKKERITDEMYITETRYEYAGVLSQAYRVIHKVVCIPIQLIFAKPSNAFICGISNHIS